MQDNIAGNAADFAQSLMEIGSVVEADVFDKIVRKVLFDLWRMVVRANPKKTGRSAASWMLDTSWSDWKLPPGDYSGSINSNISAAVQNLPVSDMYYLYNNVEYIVALENGHSQQAPAGFVAQALASLAQLVAQKAREAGYEATS